MTSGSEAEGPAFAFAFRYAKASALRINTLTRGTPKGLDRPKLFPTKLK
jgi:hypothetical protein